ncbi:hypothetical protein CKAH01_12099 [Colletotrichum kahawae]|uniref:Uncharacterized protein n=1 Tax=Colletotrichum kahawae TaxID=34407 RepID=A0AAE0DD57_COLKA|nr:hypothetical protein CKAH01_12099 [Colletotrichum kahawae]
MLRTTLRRAPKTPIRGTSDRTRSPKSMREPSWGAACSKAVLWEKQFASNAVTMLLDSAMNLAVSNTRALVPLSGQWPPVSPSVKSGGQPALQPARHFPKPGISLVPRGPRRHPASGTQQWFMALQAFI